MVLTVRNATHNYGTNQALAGVDLDVAPGEMVALLGPNGAGKTTLVRSIIGLLTPDAGEISVAGGDPSRSATRRQVGVVQQEVGFPPTLTVREVVAGAAVRAGKSTDAADDVLREVALDDMADRRAATMSGGQQQRLQLAMGLVSDPVLLVLDEPTVGLDVAARRRFWDSISARRDSGVAVLLTTHLVDEAAAVADRIVVIDRGRVVANNDPHTLVRTLPDRRIEAETGLRPADIRALDGVVDVQVAEGRTTVTATEAEGVTRWMLTNDPTLTNLTITTSRLEDVLLAMTGRTTEEVAA